MNYLETNILVCGAGIIGLTMARELRQKGYQNITIIEKEKEIGLHSSGRNSGVLHAGIYYSPESLKAKSCLRGNFLMKEYCRQNNITVAETGKVIVAGDKDELDTLHKLYDRALKNGAKVELIDKKQLAKIEPNAKTTELALYSYYTAVADPEAILKCLAEELRNSNQVKLLLDNHFLGLDSDNTANTNRGKIKFDLFINTGGSFCDKIAHHFKVGLNYKIIPFKGTYKKLKRGKENLVKGNIYPVPDINSPFLGVHFTKVITGEVFIGPTAIPAFGRENYGLIKGIKPEALKIAYQDLILLVKNSNFRKVARAEPRKYIFNYFFRDARRLVKEIDPRDIVASPKTGIRPQLVNWGTKELVMDYKIIKSEKSLHILNAISPGFTSSMDFAQYVVKNYVD